MQYRNMRCALDDKGLKVWNLNIKDYVRICILADHSLNLGASL